jgi:hypothetical protein
VKTFTSFVLTQALVISSFAAAPTLEDLSPHLSTNAQIIWKAPTNNLPKSFCIYKKLPRVFSAAVISNALMLASFQSKGLLRRHPARRSFEFSLRRIAA